VWVTDGGFSFESAKDAEAFESADWPRPHPYKGDQQGWLTSDRVLFPDSKKHLAEARQANIRGDI
jgi:hypothetical protein